MARKRTGRERSSSRRKQPLKPYQRHTPLNPAARIVSRLGGPIVVANITGTSYTAPYRWQAPRERGGTGGTIPQRYHEPLLQHARASRIKLRKIDFWPVAQQG